MLKKIFLSLLLLIIIAAGGSILAISQIITPEFVKSQIDKALDGTGHTLKIQEPIQLNKFPNLEIVLQNVDFTLKTKENIKIQQASISLALMPLLLEKKVVVKTIELDTLKADLLNGNKASFDKFNANVNLDISNINHDLPILSKENLTLAGLDGKIRIDNIKYNQFLIDLLNADIAVQNGTADINIADSKAYEANIKSDIKVNLFAEDVPLFKINSNITDLNVQSALKTIVPEGKVSLYGRGFTQSNLNFKGLSADQIIASLGGNLNLELKDSGLTGINLRERIENPMQVINQLANTQEQQTKFDIVKSSHKIKAGVISGDDLLIQSGKISIAGAGNIDLPQQVIDYRLQPTLTDSNPDNAANQDSIYVPFILSGKFDHLTFAPDINSAINNIIKSPEKTINIIKGLKKDGGKDALKKGLNLLKGNMF